MAVPAPLREIGYAGPASVGYWTVADIDEPTAELRWPLSLEVYDRMRTQDAQVQSVLRAVTLPVLRTPWAVDPAGARDEVVEHVAEDLGLPIQGEPDAAQGRTRDRFSWIEHLRLALLSLPLGHMFFEQLARVEGGRVRLHKLAPRMPRSLTRINVARDGGLVSIEQWGDGRKVSTPIPVNRLVAYVHEREAGNWYGRSLLRAAYKNWLLKDRLLRVQAQTIERNGMGVPIYEAAEDEESLTAGQAIATGYRSGSTAGAALPHGAKLRLQGVEGELPDAEPAIRYHDEQIARAVLAHFLNLGTQTGSWALGSTFADFFTLGLQTVAESLRDVAQAHVVEDLVDWNWGPDEPAPRLVFQEIGSRQAATAQALQQLAAAGILLPDRELEESVRQSFDLPPKDDAGRRPAAPAPTEGATE